MLDTRHLWSFSKTLIAAGLLLVTGCASDRFTIGGEEERIERQRAEPIERVHDRLRNSRALPTPSLSVHPPEALGRSYEDITVIEQRWIPRKDHVVLELETSSKERVRLAYKINQSNKLPLVVGATYKARIYHAKTLPNQRFLDEEPMRDDTKRHVYVQTKRKPDSPDLGFGGLQGWAFVVRNNDNSLQGILVSARWRELDSDRNNAANARGSKGLTLELLDRLAYTEVRRAKNQCRAIIEHSEVAAIADGRTLEMLPGTSARISLSEETFELTVLDASRTSDGPCGTKQEGHVSFSLIKLR